MATVLGKRKSHTQTAGPSISQDEAHAKLAQFFETKFLPVFPTEKSSLAPGIEEQPASDPESPDEDGWDGFSDDETGGDELSVTSPVVEVVSHTEAYSATKDLLDKRESKAWLSSRPPNAASTGNTSSSTNKKGKATAEEDAPSLLKNDLALQRLLAESHLFSSAAAKGVDVGDATEHVGRNRHLATDLRLSALGSKTSIYKQAKMPMAFRKGIQAAAEGREAKRRREAKENGVVLERPGASNLSKKAAKGRRKGPSRDIDGPAFGRMSNGTLTLSKKDIANIEGGGPKKGATFPKKKRR